MECYPEFHLIIITFVILATLVCTGNGMQQNVLWVKNSTFQGLSTNGQPAAVATTTSDCAMRCSEQGTAVAFFYSKATDSCRCLTTAPLSSSGLDVDPSSAFFITEGPRCTDGYTYEHSIKCCFKISTQTVNYTDAVAVCSSEGARLLYVTNERRHSYFIQYLTDNAIYHGHRYFIDGSDVIQEGEWLHSDGSRVEYINFAPGEPHASYKEGEDCLVLRHDRDFLMNDVPCRYTYRLICERV